MIVALRTANGESQDRGGHDVECFGDDLVAVCGVVGARGPVRRGSQEAGGRQQSHLFGREILVRGGDEFISGELFQ